MSVSDHQLSHDLRSPIASLKVALADLKGANPSTVSLITKAIERLSDIANALEHSLDRPLATKTQSTTTSTEPLAPLIDAALSNLRIRSPRAQDLEVSFDPITAYGIFVEVYAPQFLQSLIDLLEATPVPPDRKKIPLHLVVKKIPQGLVIQVGAKSLSLVEATPPSWFTPQIVLPEGGQAVVLDDDPSIHALWTSRLADYPRKHFSTAPDIIDWYRKAHGDSQNCVFLIDYELSHNGSTTGSSAVSGLDVIDKLGIAKQTILITSRANDPEVRARVIKTGCTLLSKSEAAAIPIVLKEVSAKIL